MNDDELLRYSRQILLPQIGLEGQAKLAAAQVLICGLGGLGSPVALYLAAAGIGKLIICDFDQLDLTNLQRQVLYSTADIGQSKALAAQRRLAALNPGIEIVSIPHSLSQEQLEQQLQHTHLIIDCTDNYASRFLINDAAVKTKTALVSGAAIRMEGQVALFRTDLASGACYRCLYEENAAGNDGSCSETGVLGPLLGIIGSMQALEAIRFLVGLQDSADTYLHLFDAMQMQWRKVRLRKDASCQCASIRQSSES